MPKGFYIEGDYMGYVYSEDGYMRFPTDDEYYEYLKEESNEELVNN